jgi:hypothetical protein
MRSWAVTTEEINGRAHRSPANIPRVITSHAARSDAPLLQRKCACGGGCPRCEAAAGHTGPLRHELANGNLQRKCGAGCDCEDCGLQTKTRIGPAGDAFEQEADTLAERLANGERVVVRGQTGRTLHAKSAGATRGEVAASIGHGQPLPISLQREFGPRLGRDLSKVRIHTGAAADAAASSVAARAFTLGSDLVFGSNEFAPDSVTGRHLIAHELVHWVQQHGQSDRLQRNLKVDAKASDDPTTAISQMTPTLNKICPDFNVDVKTGDVTAKSGSNCEKGKFGAVATGSQKVGCCCLCTLARAPNNWKIIVTINNAPTTIETKREIRMIPASGSSVPDLRSWTSGPKEKIVGLPAEEALGHEMCGHAALMQIKAHPADETTATSRTFSDIHDPTVKIENVLAGKGEMDLGLAARGLASSSKHHGESLRVFVVRPFAPDDAKISSTAQAIIDGAATFADANANKLVDVVGFSDKSDKVAGIGKTRANAVRTALDAKMTEKGQIAFHPSPGAKEVKLDRIQPAVDGGAGTAAEVQIRLAREPTGLENLPSTITLPATVTHVDPKNPAVVDPVVKKGKSTGNDCHDLLIKTAWT